MNIRVVWQSPGAVKQEFIIRSNERSPHSNAKIYGCAQAPGICPAALILVLDHIKVSSGQDHAGFVSSRFETCHRCTDHYPRSSHKLIEFWRCLKVQVPIQSLEGRVDIIAELASEGIAHPYPEKVAVLAIQLP